DVRIILGYPEPPALYAQEWQIVEVDCPSDDEDENMSEENLSNDTMELSMLNDTDDENSSWFNASNMSNVSWEGLTGERKRCYANITMNVSLNITGDVEPFV
ncbi:LanA, partial [Symbiodinium natans]